MQFQQFVGVVGIAGLELRITLQQLERQHILLEGDSAEAVTRASVVMQPDRGLMSLQIDLNGVFNQPGFEIAALGRQRFQILLELLVVGLIENLPVDQRYFSQQFLKDRVILAFAKNFHVHRINRERWAGFDVIPRLPTVRRALQRRLDHRLVIAEGLQRLADLAGGVIVQPAQSAFFRGGFPGKTVEFQCSQHVVAQWPVQSLDLHRQRPVVGGFHRSQQRRIRLHRARSSNQNQAAEQQPGGE